MTRKIKVFLSSTMENLKKERLMISGSLESLDIFEVIKAEDFPAAEHSPQQVCNRGIDESDLVLAITSDNYGFIPEHNNPEQLSVPHLEYRHAKRKKKPILVFIKHPVADNQNIRRFVKELENFEEGHFRNSWTKTTDLKAKVARSSLWWLARKYRDMPFEQIPNDIRLKVKNIRHFNTGVSIEVNEPARSEIQSMISNVINRISTKLNHLLLPIPIIITKSNTHKTYSTLRTVVIPESNDSVLLGWKYEDVDNVQILDVRPNIKLNIHNKLFTEIIEMVFFVCSYLSAQSPYGAMNVLTHKIEKDFKDMQHIVSVLLQFSLRITLKYGCMTEIIPLLEKVIELDAVSEELYMVSFFNLGFLEKRFSSRNISRGIEKINKVCLRLTEKMLSEKNVNPAGLYNYARSVMPFNKWLCVRLLNMLATTHPFYEERWYWHRDLGLCYYDLQKYEEAARHYLIAADLKKDDSETYRFAGDGFYYNGDWVRALDCYEMAVKIEPTEYYYLKEKMIFARSKNREKASSLFTWKRTLGYTLESLGVWLVNRVSGDVGVLVFRLVVGLNALLERAPEYLALYSNRKGNFALAIRYLRMALYTIPENQITRANLVLNQIFLKKGEIDSETKEEIKISLFHGGPNLISHFRVSLSLTQNKESILNEIAILLSLAKSEREERMRRRKEVLKPREFDDIMHVEFRE